MKAKCLSTTAATLIATTVLLAQFASAAPAPPTRPLPVFEIDPNWPKLPANFSAPFVSGVMIDPQGNAWLTTRPIRTQKEAGKIIGPPLMIFDPNGNYIRGWGGPGPGYEWPASEHNAYIDYKGFVWLTGDSCKGRTSPVDDDQVLKFTQDGKFVLQIGHSDAGKGRQRHRKFPPSAQCASEPEDERTLRRRRLRQSPHHRARRRHRKVQAHVGRLRQTPDGPRMVLL